MRRFAGNRIDPPGAPRDAGDDAAHPAVSLVADIGTQSLPCSPIGLTYRVGLPRFGAARQPRWWPMQS